MALGSQGPSHRDVILYGILEYFQYASSISHSN